MSGCEKVYRNSYLSLLIFILALSIPHNTSAEISFTSHWVHSGSSYACGIGWTDINGDTTKDLVVSNGLDAANAANEVYYNFNGEFSTAPGWSSSTQYASGNLYLGDFDSNGQQDILIANMGINSQGFPPVPRELYLSNFGLTSEPSVLIPINLGFSCSGGDFNNDGLLDICFANGANAINPNNSQYRKAEIFLNGGGATFSETPDWESDGEYSATDIAIADIDNDGDFDLALSGRNWGLMIYYNNNGVMETTPSWSIDTIIGARQMAFGDVDGDGYQDLVIAELEPYGTNGGKYTLFMNDNGTLETEPSWVCDLYVEPSAVAWADVDGDGDLDLGGSGWNSHIGVFENVDGVLSDSYTWSSNAGWTNQIAWGDYDEDGIILSQHLINGDGEKKVYSLGRKNIHEINSVQVNNEEVALTEYCYDLLEGWISFASAPPADGTIEIEYKYSNDLDLAVTSSSQVRIFENLTQNIEDPEVNILVVVDHDFGANYNFTFGDPSINIRDHFAQYGWEMTVAGMTTHIDSCSESARFFGSTSEDVDTIFTDIDDLSNYDAITIMPGRAHSLLLGSDEAINMITEAVNSGMVVSTWCRATRVLIAAGVMNGIEMVGHADYTAEYTAAGCIYLGNDHPPVTDGNIITSVRSRFYRTEICEAIREAVETNMSVDDNEDDIPVRFNLRQNYPNPFNPTTEIRFDLVKTQNVKLRIYNLMGQEVANLVNREMNAGSYSINFDASNLASGVYVYKIETNLFTDSKKMVLVK
jgi:putative intracellular protease/amidase